MGSRHGKLQPGSPPNHGKVDFLRPGLLNRPRPKLGKGFDGPHEQRMIARAGHQRFEAGAVHDRAGVQVQPVVSQGVAVGKGDGLGIGVYRHRAAPDQARAAPGQQFFQRNHTFTQAVVARHKAWNIPEYSCREYGVTTVIFSPAGTEHQQMLFAGGNTTGCLSLCVSCGSWS